MKLLLTSGGLTNKTIAQSLLDLAGKKAKEICVAFIPTAANSDQQDKGWYIDDLYQLKQQNYKIIDIVDISALPREIWQPRLESADVLIFSGGNSSHLMRWVEDSGLKELLTELLQKRVYVGISAGSIIVSPTLALSNKDKKALYKEKFGYEIKEGLGFINFYIRPHFNSPEFLNARRELLKETAKEISEPLYGIDDQMAIKVVDGKMELVGEGKYIVFNGESSTLPNLKSVVV